MSVQIDFRTLPVNVPVLCIPRVYPNISESRIRRIFEDLDMGTLERIDIVSKQTEKGEKFNRVFVHFRRWNNSSNACIARERLLNGKEIKIIYDEPWFWKISAYREVEKKQEFQPRNAPKKPTIQFDSDEEKPRNQDLRPRNQDLRPRNQDLRPRNQEEIPTFNYGEVTIKKRNFPIKKEARKNDPENQTQKLEEEVSKP